jgi:hypothetical protein
VREALLGFLADRPKLILDHGVLQVLDDRIVYTEGPYAGKLHTDVVAKSDVVVDPLLSIAQLMEAG